MGLYAQKLLDQLQNEQQQVAKEHKAHLDVLWEAVLSRDPAAVKKARDSAKKAGIPVKEIGRIYALAQAAVEAAVPEAAGTPGATETPTQETSTQDSTSVPCVSPAPCKDDVESQEPCTHALEVTMFDGQWYSKASGDLMATISGLKLVTPDGEIEAHQSSERGMAFDMEGEQYRAELDDQECLVWNDGDIWTRQNPGHDNQHVDVSDDVNVSAPVAVSSSEGAEPPVTTDTLDVVFDGYWVGAEGEHMATIKGLTIHWADGPPQELETLAADAVRCELFGEVLSATLGADGRLTWSDGDIWTCITKPGE